MYGPELVGRGWSNHHLGLDERFTVALNDLFDDRGPNLNSADLAIVVTYQIPIIHLQRQKTFPFIAHKQINGQFYWYPEPVP